MRLHVTKIEILALQHSGNGFPSVGRVWFSDGKEWEFHWHKDEWYFAAPVVRVIKYENVETSRQWERLFRSPKRALLFDNALNSDSVEIVRSAYFAS